MDQKLPINEEKVEDVISAVKSTAAQNLLKVAVARARMEFMRTPEQTEREWQAQLPAAPFDMEFFAKVLAKVFQNEEIIIKILNGASISTASGWNAE